MQDLKKEVQEHHYQIKCLEDSNKEIMKISRETNSDVKELILLSHKHDLVLEKITYINKRVDLLENNIKTRGDIGCSALHHWENREQEVVTRLEENTKSNEKRLKDLESSKKWLTLTVFGIIVTAIMKMIIKQ